MRRLEVERIDERAGGQPPVTCGYRANTRRPLGLGPEMRPSGLKSCPPTRVDGRGREATVWCGACAPCLARTAPGGVGAPPGWVLWPACEELADGVAQMPPQSAA